MAVLGEQGIVDESITKEVAIKGGSQSPEMYFGASRNQNFGNGSPGVVGKQNNLVIPKQQNPNTLYFSGDWNITDEFAQSSSLNAGIVYQYIAKDVFFV